MQTRCHNQAINVAIETEEISQHFRHFKISENDWLKNPWYFDKTKHSTVHHVYVQAVIAINQEASSQLKTEN